MIQIIRLKIKIIVWHNELIHQEVSFNKLLLFLIDSNGPKSGRFNENFMTGWFETTDLLTHVHSFADVTKHGRQPMRGAAKIIRTSDRKLWTHPDSGWFRISLLITIAHTNGPFTLRHLWFVSQELVALFCGPVIFPILVFWSQTQFVEITSCQPTTVLLLKKYLKNQLEFNNNRCE